MMYSNKIHAREFYFSQVEALIDTRTHKKFLLRALRSGRQKELQDTWGNVDNQHTLNSTPDSLLPGILANEILYQFKYLLSEKKRVQVPVIHLLADKSDNCVSLIPRCSKSAQTFEVWDRKMYWSENKFLPLTSKLLYKLQLQPIILVNCYLLLLLPGSEIWMQELQPQLDLQTH